MSKAKKERIRRYRRYLYEARAINRPDKMQAQDIDAKNVDKERKKEIEICRVSRFLCRTRDFTDSGNIGSKDFDLRIIRKDRCSYYNSDIFAN